MLGNEFDTCPRRAPGVRDLDYEAFFDLDRRELLAAYLSYFEHFRTISFAIESALFGLFLVLRLGLQNLHPRFKSGRRLHCFL